MTWLEEALCRGMDRSIFFPEDGEYDEARAICDCCPVKNPCAEYAHGFEWDKDGMFGGLTPRERMFIRDKRLGVIQ